MLILEKKPKSIVSEAYRTLRTNIQFSKFDGELKTILVTSSGPSEGKSSTACNLAMAFAQGDKKVLVVDCDLRKPTVHKKFKVFNKVGLSNCLINGMDLHEVVIKYRDNLHILTSGTIPPNPAEMVASDKMKKILEEMKKEYDYIIIDSPPLLAVTDAQILSTEADGTILVVAAGESHKDACIKAKDLLQKVNATILGVVLSKIDENSGYGYGNKYYYYYGNGNENTKPKSQKLITRNA